MGTTVRLEDVTAGELVALDVIALVVLSLGWWRWKVWRARHEGMHYSLEKDGPRKPRR